MNTKEVANIIIKLRQEGWDDTKINDFMLFVGTHTPTEAEVKPKAENIE